MNLPLVQVVYTTFLSSIPLPSASANMSRQRPPSNLEDFFELLYTCFPLPIIIANMPSHGRALRSSSKAAPASSSAASSPPAQALAHIISPISFITPNTSIEPIRIIPKGSKLPHLNAADLQLLRSKQAKLIKTALQTTSSLPQPTSPCLLTALSATLIFAQYEAGTAVCIDSAGWILTCAHCFGDDEEEYEGSERRKWCIFYTGLAVLVECRIWDGKGDLALLKIVAVEYDLAETAVGKTPMFSFVPLSRGVTMKMMPLLCIGQPGRDDLEATSEKKTKYNLVEISEGVCRGIVKDADPQDNSEIGSLMHDAWTYWGHSGAPLVSVADGTLAGLHSSWDDETAMRHGVPGVAIRVFLEKVSPDVLKSFSADVLS